VQATVAAASTATVAPVVAGEKGSFAEAMRQDEILHVGSSSEHAGVNGRERVASTAAANSSAVAVANPKTAGISERSVASGGMVLKPRVVAGAATEVLPQEMDEADTVVQAGPGDGSAEKNAFGLEATSHKNVMDAPAVAVTPLAKDAVAEKVAVSLVMSRGIAVSAVSKGGGAEGNIKAKSVAAIVKLVKHSTVQGVKAAVGEGQAAVVQGGSTPNVVGGVQPVVTQVVVAPVCLSLAASASSPGMKVGVDDKDGGTKEVQSVGTGTDVIAGKAATPEDSALVVGTAASGSAVAGGSRAVAVSGVEKFVATSGLPMTAVPMPGVQVASDVNARRMHEGMSISSGGQNHEAKELTLQTYEGSRPNRLEVGLQGGAFGWLKVRAELGANGDVNTYLRGASSGAVELLQTQASKIEAYLGAQAVVVKSVQVETVQSPSSSTGAGVMGDGTASGSGSQQGQSGSRKSGYEGSVETFEQTSGGDSVMLPQVMSSTGGILYTGNGSWLSVRA
jgi:hypothetical protein